VSARLANVVFARTTGKPERGRIAIRRFRFPSRLYFLLFSPAVWVPMYALACAFFSFSDENVMSEVEIAGRGQLDVLKVRIEFVVLRNKAININKIRIKN